MCVNSYGLIVKRIWSDSNEDLNMYKLGIVRPTEEECEKAHDRELAEVRLRRTSTFEPDFEDENADSGYVVGYDKTREEAEKSIQENEKDWKIYFGIDSSDSKKQPAAEQKGFWWEK